jgi:cytoskeletal protein CcmA (bactofilin family)
MSVLLCLTSAPTQAQTRTINSSGDWSTASIWQGNNIGDVLSENVNFSNTITVTVLANYTVGNVTMGNNNTWTIGNNSGNRPTFNIGSSGNARNLSVPNGATINVYGNVIIWGNLVVSNNLELNVFSGGSLTVRGNVIVQNNAGLTINGSMQVDGNFTANNQLDLIVNGALRVNGVLTTGANATGSGNIQAGSCTSSTTGFCTSVTPLPVTLLSFKVSAVSDGVLAEWVTVQEENNAYFTLERSTDGRNFTTAGIIPGAVNSSAARTYQFTDTNPITGMSYYRLRQADLDGRTETFPVRAVRFGAEGPLVDVYPNPSKDGVVTINSRTDKRLQASVFDQLGRLLHKTFLQSGTNILPLGSSCGLYLIHVIDNSGKLIENRRVIMQ